MTDNKPLNKKGQHNKHENSFETPAPVNPQKSHRSTYDENQIDSICFDSRLDYVS